MDKIQFETTEPDKFWHGKIIEDEQGEKYRVENELNGLITAVKVV